jgi:hypothetical protein
MKIVLSDGQGELHPTDTTSISIKADDGRELYEIRLEGGELKISTGMTCKHEGVMLDEKLLISPKFANAISIERKEYK